MRSNLLAFSFLCIFLLSESKAADRAESVARFVVHAGDCPRIDTPVAVALDWLEPSDEYSLVEIVGQERRTTPCQFIIIGQARRLSWILAGTTDAGDQRTYELVRERSPEGEGVRLCDTQGAVEVLRTGKPVLRYNHDVVPPPKGASPLYARSGFIHPIWTPAGEVVTAIHPSDHIHHMGLWNPWTRAEFEGRNVDLWNLRDGLGTVRFREYAAKFSGPVAGGFAAIQEHVDLKAPGGAKVAINEEFAVSVWNVRGGNYFLIDMVTSQRCASSSPVLLKAYRYGGLGFRATRAWKGGDYLTSEGLTRKNGHGSRARWCEVHAPGDPPPAGVLFMSHPSNREHPEPVRIWPGDGDLFFNFCPVQKSDWKLEPGNVYVLQYRLCVHTGPMDPKAAERLWRDFADPPRVEVERLKK